MNSDDLKNSFYWTLKVILGITRFMGEVFIFKKYIFFFFFCFQFFWETSSSFSFTSNKSRSGFIFVSVFFGRKSDDLKKIDKNINFWNGPPNIHTLKEAWRTKMACKQTLNNSDFVWTFKNLKNNNVFIWWNMIIYQVFYLDSIDLNDGLLYM